MNKISILSPEAIRSRLRRMAYEVYERNYLEAGLTVIGIDERGGYLAGEMVDYLRQISELDVQLVEAHLDRQPGSLGIDLDVEAVQDLQDQVLLVVDDVLYTGWTMLHVVSILLQASPKAIQTAVLIDRGHRQLPVSADMTGLQLATTIQQHVSVEIDPATGYVEAFLL
jgi:pyrimidine operon attenuation protein/uracil phosphoribosyltransferase